MVDDCKDDSPDWRRLRTKLAKRDSSGNRSDDTTLRQRRPILKRIGYE